MKDTDAPAPPARLTAQEVEEITRPLYERSLAEMKAEWHKRFQDRQREEQPAE